MTDKTQKSAGENELPSGGVVYPLRKIGITISGLEQWKDGIVSGAEVRVDILQKGKCIHSEIFSGKASQPFTREVSVHTSNDDLVTVHNRPDLPSLKVTAAFTDGLGESGATATYFLRAGVISSEPNIHEQLRKFINEYLADRLRKEQQPGGLLNKQ
ncbi:hypothetical protein [Pantoea endophytica]